MDPYDNQRDTREQLDSGRNPVHLRDRDRTAGTSGPHQPAPDGLSRDTADGTQPQATDRQPRHSDGFTMIPPNESRRSKMNMISQKELEDLQRWKEANRVSSVHENPERLGGTVTLAEARQKQFTDLRCAKLQKKLRKEELDRKRRQEEEEELQKMKNEKREMAERQEERRRQEEQRRREQFKQDHLRKKETFLQRFERSAPSPPASSSATHTSSGSAALAGIRKEGPKSVREVQLDHRRVNSAFLDKLEGQGGGSKKEREGDDNMQEAEYLGSASEDFRRTTPGQQSPLSHLDHSLEQSWTEEADTEPDYDWALMKLMTVFPDCSREFLEDILNQCNGDYEHAHTLLICSLT